MKSLFDLLSIFSGIIGLGGIVVNAGSLTAENAAVQSARAVIVLAFVVVPFFVARAIEKTEIKFPAPHLKPERARKIPAAHAARSVQPATQTTYFDYFFKPGSAYDWQSSSITTLQQKKTRGDTSSVE